MREGNVFTSVCQSVHRGEGEYLWSRVLSRGGYPWYQVPSGGGYVQGMGMSRVWVCPGWVQTPSPDIGHGTLLLTLNGDHYMYGQQAGSIHPTGILSFYNIVMLSIGGGLGMGTPSLSNFFNFLVVLAKICQIIG